MPTTGTVVCHNDLYRGNIVFRNGRAVGLIDFDFAHPADPLWDLAVAAWHWVRSRRGGTPDVSRDRWADQLRLFVDAYGVPAAKRHEVIECLAAFLSNVRARADIAGRHTQQVIQDIQVLDQQKRRLLAALSR